MGWSTGSTWGSQWASLDPSFATGDVACVPLWLGKASICWGRGWEEGKGVFERRRRQLEGLLPFKRAEGWF